MIESIAESSSLPLIGLCISFLIAIILIRRKINFGLSLTIGSIILGIFSLTHINILEIPQSFIQAIIFDFNSNQITFETIELAILMVLIFLLAKTMQETGAIELLINNLKTIFKKGQTMALIPAIYGLMPVPGGALFSAPLVDKEGDQFCLSKNQKNFLNVWFRHIWFPIYPISSAMILICDKDFTGLSYDIPLYQLITANIPSFLLFIIIGSFFVYFFKKDKKIKEQNTKKEYKKLTFLLIPTTPILLYILIFFITIPFPSFSIYDYQKVIFIIGLILSLIILYYLIPISLKEYLHVIKKSLSFKIAFAIIGIMIFREMFNTTGVNYMLADLIKDISFAPLFIIIFIPLILGIVTGYNLGAIALSYVVIQPLFSATQINIIGLTSIIFMSSLAGYLISPIHLCNVVSSEHFKTDTTRMYKMYIPSVLILLLLQTIFILSVY